MQAQQQQLSSTEPFSMEPPQAPAAVQTAQDLRLAWTSSKESARRLQLETLGDAPIARYPEHECRDNIPQEYQEIELGWYKDTRREFERCKPRLTLSDVQSWYAVVQGQLQVKEPQQIYVEHHFIGKCARKSSWIAWMFVRKMWPREQLHDIAQCISKEWSTDDVFEDAVPINWPLSYTLMCTIVRDVCGLVNRVFHSTSIIPDLGALYHRYLGLVQMKPGEPHKNTRYNIHLMKQVIEVFFYQTTGGPPRFPTSVDFTVNIINGVVCSLNMVEEFQTLVDEGCSGVAVTQASGDEDYKEAPFLPNDCDEAIAEFKLMQEALCLSPEWATAEALKNHQIHFSNLLMDSVREINARTERNLVERTELILRGQQRVESRIFGAIRHQARPSQSTRTDNNQTLHGVVEASVGRRLDAMEIRLENMHVMLQEQHMLAERIQALFGGVAASR
ncbi:hypothetical protein L249_8243 [Ophiocordyceps polyrhachis-furcata BCC 54312]|uniref:Uncharacterized protein n=1 Tax=Ophiocordyceps polyrhachis-furcata BCC 54312 TaxID=1330021 RepID=A0A367LHC9_9HYPO|nr:hypothetical protein L249_8243 [Ophiocordyceps polyrhachis-furcata BCC 54312]